MSASVWARYSAYLSTPPEQVVEWNDPDTDARGWLVINSLRGGAAGGGTRMRKGVTREEVTYLAKAMQLKFAFSGPPIGGGKSGIDFDPADPRRIDVLRRWYRAVQPFLTSRYGTGGDVNVDEHRDVVPLCSELGIVHPQEGVVRGHLGLSGTNLKKTFDSLAHGLGQLVDGDYGVEGAELTVSDLITGYGVARAAERLAFHRRETLSGIRVVVEGFGNVGAAAALYLARMGALIVGIIDARTGLVSPGGLGPEEVADLVRRRQGRVLPDHPLRVEGPEREMSYRVDADLFVPAAISGSVDARRLAQLARHGIRRIVCGANQPFRETRLGDTETTHAADSEFEVMPPIVASMGMARSFYHLMVHTEDQSATQIFQAVGADMADAVDAVMERVGSSRTGITADAVALALERTA
ncbi:MAG: Glu/Leu/Phe/Val dehydrogenase dimerization domain-containing protein [Gemmatimonadota bacterium]